MITHGSGGSRRIGRRGGRARVGTVKLVYKPLGIIFGLLAGLVSKKIFEQIWGLIDKEEPPKPTTEEASWPRVLAAAAVQGITFKVTRAAVDRAGAKGFASLTGTWPGERRPEPE